MHMNAMSAKLVFDDSGWYSGVMLLGSCFCRLAECMMVHAHEHHPVRASLD